MVKQISVFLENIEGNLAEFSRLLSENDINPKSEEKIYLDESKELTKLQLEPSNFQTSFI